MAVLNVALLSLLLPAVLAMPQQHNAHSKFHTRPSGAPYPRPSGSGGSDSPYPTGGPTAPFPIGNGTAPLQTGTGVITLTLQSTITIVPLPASSNSYGGTGDQESSSQKTDNYPALSSSAGNSGASGSGAGALSAAGASLCVAPTVTVTSANTITITVQPAESKGASAGQAAASSAIIPPVASSLSPPYAAANSSAVGPTSDSGVPGTGLPGTGLPSASNAVGSKRPDVPTAPASSSSSSTSSAVPVSSTGLASYNAGAQPDVPAALVSSSSSSTSSAVPSLAPYNAGAKPDVPAAPVSSSSPSVAPAPAQSTSSASPAFSPTSSSASIAANGLNAVQKTSTKAVSSATPSASSGSTTSGGTTSSKRGISYNGASGGLSAANGMTGMGWACDWDMQPNAGMSPSDPGKLNYQFVPMMWGEKSLQNWKSANLAGYPWLMAFNEPDNAGQANMGPADVVKHFNDWIMPKRSGSTKVTSPCYTNAGSVLLDGFLTSVGGSSSVDAVCFHWHGHNLDDLKTSVSSFVDVAKKHGISEIWLNEMSPYQWPSVSDFKQWVDYLENKSGLTRFALDIVDNGMPPIDVMAAYTSV